MSDKRYELVDNDFMGSGESVAFENIGDTVTGIVTKIEHRRSTDTKGKPVFWEDGSPKLIYVWQLLLSDGEYTNLWVRSNMVKALRDAATEAGVKAQSQLIGATVTVTHTGLGDKKPGQNAAKLFEATVILVGSPSAPEKAKSK